MKSIVDEKELLLKKRILEVAKKLFLRFGFSRVTTKEIAENLGISKKTLYKFYPKKEILIEEIFISFREEILNKIDEILNDKKINLIDKIKLIMKTAGIMLSKLDREVIEDLKKSYPKIVKKLEKFEVDQLLLKIEQLISEGVEKGYFKKSLNTKVLVKFYFESIKNFISIENLEYINIPIQDFFDSILIILFEGALSREYQKEYYEKKS